MEQQHTAAPVDHGVLSATGNVALGAAGGFFKKGAIVFGLTVLACTGIGALIGVAGVGAVATSGAFVGGALGAVGGLFAGTFVTGPIGAAVGAFTGGGRAVNQVKMEKGAANVMQAQVEAYKAQAQAEAMAASNDNKYQFPPKGSPMNQAGSTVNAMQADGRVDGMQLQRA